MSDATATMLQDRLNDIERNICDGIDFRQELNEAYALADELQAENEQLREQLKASDDGRERQADNLIDKYHKIARLQTENAKLREFATHMANALGIDSEWCDPEWCDSDCMDEFKCRPTGDYGEIHCPAWARMRSLGIEVTS